MTGFEHEEATVASLAARLEAGEISSAALTRAYLDRIDALDRGERGLHSVIEVNADAESVARTLDDERRAGGVRGPLHGIPVLVKDNLETADGMATSAGSLALAEHRARRDAGVVERLRRAGAIVLGKANLSEWANFRSFRSSSGWSARGGQCRNPYDPERNPGGSSSGSAAAVSANLCAVAIGTETDGSIVCPASACGVVGIKPTVGLVSRAGIIPIAPSQDTAGPMARTVADAAALLTAIAGSDPRDPETRAASSLAQNYLAALDRDGLAGARLGVAREFFGHDPRVDAILEEAIAVMVAAGAEMFDVDLSTGNDYLAAEYEVLLYEFKASLNAFLSSVDARLGASSLAEIIEFNRRHAELEMPFFAQEIFEVAAAKGGLDSAEYLAARATCARLSRGGGLDRVLAKNRLDAVIAPTGGPAWRTDHESGDGIASHLSSSRPAAVSGYPAITLPAGFVERLPVGLTFMGAAWSESTLVRLAYAFESATEARRRPPLP